MVERVAFEGGRATGVAFTQGRRQAASAAAAGEVILAAGAVGSPEILELSGIGDARAAARRSASRCVHHAPASARTCRIICSFRPVYKVEGVRTLNTDYAKLWGGPRWRWNMLSCGPGR